MIFSQVADFDYFIHDGYVWRRIPMGQNTIWPRQNASRIVDAMQKHFKGHEFVVPVEGGEEPEVYCQRCGQLRVMSQVIETGTEHINLTTPDIFYPRIYVCMDMLACRDNVARQMQALSSALHLS